MGKYCFILFVTAKLSRAPFYVFLAQHAELLRREDVIHVRKSKGNVCVCRSVNKTSVEAVLIHSTQL